MTLASRTQANTPANSIRSCQATRIYTCKYLQTLGRSTAFSSTFSQASLTEFQGEDTHNGSLQERLSRWWKLIPIDEGPPVTVWVAIKSVWGMTAGVRGWVAGGLIFLMLSAGCEVLYPHLATKAMEAAQHAGASALSNPDFTIWQALRYPDHKVACELTLLALVAVSETVFTALRGTCSSVITLSTVRRLRSSVFSTLLQQEKLWFQNNGRNAASMASRLASDCEAVSKMVSINFNVALRYGLQTVGAIGYLAFLDSFIALYCLVCASVMSWLSFKYGRFSRSATRGERHHNALASSRVEESLRSIQVVKAHGYEGQELNRYQKQLSNLVQLAYLKMVGYVGYILFYNGFWHKASLVVLYYGGCMVASGQMTFAQLTAAFLYSDQVFDSCKVVCEQTASVMENIGTVDTVLKCVTTCLLLDCVASRLNRLLELEKTNGTLQSKSPMIEPHPSIWKEGVKLEDVHFQYPGRKRKVLDNVSLKFASNCATGIVGPSGSGKSTIAQMLTGVLQPDHGSVRIGDLDLKHVKRDWLTDKIAEVPQSPMLFTATVFENISYGFDGATMDQVVHAAKAANAHEFITRLPHGYHTSVSDASLSGGQRQRISIARALFRTPRLLVLDEATSALDAGTESAVQETLDTIISRHNLIVVIVAHRMATVRNCERIIVMDKGKVIEEGDHESLIDANGLYASLVSQQMCGNTSEDDSDDADERCNGAVAKSHAENSGNV